MISRGFMRKGTAVTIHPYHALSVPFARLPGGKAPFEIHFFPGLKKVFVVGHRSP